MNIFSLVYKHLFELNPASFVTQALQYILMTAIVLNVFAIGLVFVYGDTIGVVIYSLFIPIGLLCIYLLRIGQTTLVKFIFIYGIFAIGMYRAFVTLGVHAPIYMALVVLVLASTIIYQAQTGAYLAAVAIIGGLFMLGVDDIREQLVGDPWISATNMWGAMANVYILAAAIGYFLRRTTDEALQTAHENEQALAEYNQQLEAEIEQRQIIEKNLIRTQSLYRSIVQDQPNFIVRWQPDGTVIYANNAYCDFHDMTLEEMEGANFFSWSSDEVKKSMKTKLSMMSPDNAVITSVHPINEEDETAGWHQWIDRGIFDSDDQLVMIQSVGLDITARKQLDESMVKLRVAEAREAFLEDFLSTVTHDLKTPLSVMSTSLYLAERTQDTDGQSAQFGKIKSQIDILTQMINNLLSVTRLRNIPELELASVAIHPIIEQIHAQLAPKAKVKDITFIADCTPQDVAIMADAEQLERILLNLMDNAINYTSEGGKVTVSTIASEDKVVITVSDTGIGIPDEDLAFIFTRFYRATNAKDIEGGTGLGLAIVKRIVELHHGTITVESTVDVGTKFTLTFPQTP